MFGKHAFIAFTCSLLVFCETAFVDNLGKCAIADAECQRTLLQSVIRDIAKTGIPDYDIPPIDPFKVKNVTVSVLNMVDIILVDGTAKGVKDCIVDKLETHVEKEKATLELTCDLVVKGKYKAFGSSPLIKNILGGSTVHGEGTAKLKIDKIHMVFEYHFYIRDRNGEIFIECQHKDLKYSYTLGKVTFAANNLYIGETESSGIIVGLLNDNWKFIMDSFGKPFMDKAMDLIYEQTHKFFDVVPTKYYLTDDLTSYIKKD